MREAKITPLYERLSRDDGDDKESNSISTQKNLLEQYAKNNGLPNPTHFTDATDILGLKQNPTKRASL